LTVPKGCLYGLLGPTVRPYDHRPAAIALHPAGPDSGSVRVAARLPCPSPGPCRELLGYVAQEVAIDKILTGRELLELQGALYHLNAKAPAGADPLNSAAWLAWTKGWIALCSLLRRIAGG